MGRRRGEPTRIYRRGQRGRGMGFFGKLKLFGMIAVIVAIIGYVIWLFVFKPAPVPAATSWSVWLPLVGR
jgi:hypothetical protein